MSNGNPFGERRGLEANVTVEPSDRVPGSAARLTVAGVPFGDPMAAVRLDRQKRWLFFDLGSFSQIPARTAHQISDVFVSHAHVDHVCGFPWFLGRRINDAGDRCRLYGPPGFAQHVNAMIHSFVWDRVGQGGARLDVAEIHHDHLRWFHVTVGDGGLQEGDSTPIAQGVLLHDPLFQIRTLTLDHGIPVQAYLLEEQPRYRLLSERLPGMGLSPGPWIAELQRAANAQAWDTPIALPHGQTANAQELTSRLMEVQRGQTLVYATDFADTPANRDALVAFAQDADLLVCETSYLHEDADHATRTGHMTARACAEIARAANVQRLLPFHFSSRYIDHPQRLYQEMAAIFPALEVPHELQSALAPS